VEPVNFAASQEGLRSEDLTQENIFITWDIFELLTGRQRLNITKRVRLISITRDKGHVRLFDQEFIPGERYKKDKKMYICRVVSSEDGTALFEPENSSNLEVLSTCLKYSMEIA